MTGWGMYEVFKYYRKKYIHQYIDINIYTQIYVQQIIQ